MRVINKHTCMYVGSSTKESNFFPDQKIGGMARLLLNKLKRQDTNDVGKKNSDIPEVLKILKKY